MHSGVIMLIQMVKLSIPSIGRPSPGPAKDGMSKERLVKGMTDSMHIHKALGRVLHSVGVKTGK